MSTEVAEFFPQRDRIAMEVAKSEINKDEAIEVLEKQVAEIQKKLDEYKKSDLSKTLAKRITELESQLAEAKKSATLCLLTGAKNATSPAIPQKKCISLKERTCWGMRLPESDSGRVRSCLSPKRQD